MNIHQLLKEEQIILDLDRGSKAEVIEALVAILQERGLIPKDRGILRKLMKREYLSSTALEKGIAVPHALTEKVKEPFLALARLKKSVNFEAADGMPTNILLIVLGNKSHPALQLKCIAHICRLVKETDFVDKVRKAKTAREICQILKREEEKI